MKLIVPFHNFANAPKYVDTKPSATRQRACQYFVLIKKKRSEEKNSNY